LFQSTDSRFMSPDNISLCKFGYSARTAVVACEQFLNENVNF